MDIETRGIMLSRKRIKKVLIRLRRCVGLSAPLLFAYGKTGFLMTWFIALIVTEEMRRLEKGTPSRSWTQRPLDLMRALTSDWRLVR